MLIRNIKLISALVATQLFSPLFCETIGLVGGNDSNGPYAALVFSDGTLIQLPTVVAVGGEISSVDIGRSLIGLIGGVKDPAFSIPYAELVLPDGTLIDLTPNLPVAGSIRSVSINNTGSGLIGGIGIANSAYAAFVSPTGTVAPIGPLPAPGNILAVSINDSGNGIIGGRNAGGAIPYAAFVASDGTLTNIAVSGFPAGGSVVSVAINSSGTGLIGGGNFGGASTAFAAFVAPGGAITQLPVTLGASSRINSVSINDSGQGIIGGLDFTILPGFGYAALVSSGGSLLSLPGMPNPGEIRGVAINSSGVGIIGGDAGSGGVTSPYAAFVGVDGAVTPISLTTLTGSILGVAINNSGVGLVGGGDGVMHYGALVAPNGTVTLLSPLGGPGFIFSVSLIDALTPLSIGPYSSAINSVLATSNALNAHISVHHKRLSLDDEFRYRTDIAALVADAAFGETVDAGDGLTQDRQISSVERAIAENAPETQCCKIEGYTAFVVPFYDHTHQKADRAIPAFTNDIGGALAALEYTTVNDMVLGGGLSYAFNYTHYSESFGHAKINTEMAVLYASFNWDHFFLNATVWGGLYQLHNERHTPPPLAITSTLKTHGWTLSPHVELSYTYNNACKWFFAEIFGMADWVNSWQHHAREKGSSGLNLVLDGTYASLLRSELGLRFYEVLRYDWGRLLIFEKASYINRTPFHFNRVNTFFVGGSASSFSVSTGSSTSQNLAGLELNLTFLPCNENYPYVSIDAQGEFGSSFQSYFAGLEIGKKF